MVLGEEWKVESTWKKFFGKYFPKWEGGIVETRNPLKINLKIFYFKKIIAFL